MTLLPSFTDLALQSQNVLIIGIGGGGDVIAALPIANYLLKLGEKRLYIGSTACSWLAENASPDDNPDALRVVMGPCVYDVNGLTDSTVIFRTIALVTRQSHFNGVNPAEALLIDQLPGTAFVAGLTLGVSGLASGLTAAIKSWNIDLVVAVDVGSDSWHNGKEVLGAKSALVDFMALAALYDLEIPTVYGLAGFGLDGEMLPHELEARVAHVMSAGGFLGGLGLTQTDVRDISIACQKFPDPILSMLPLAAQGKHGWHRVNTYSPWGTPVYVGPLAANILFFDLKTLCRENSEATLLLRLTNSLAEAEEIFRRSTKQIPETTLNSSVEFGRRGSGK